ncbi:MAG: hypothetical protein HUU26_01530 [Gemmatimonadaceae bacterium]|nr:hypothetical protein [Gemmatimonadaceae bacterium]
MKALLGILALNGALTGAPSTRRQSPCTSAEHRQFDFWLGEWTVINAQGGLAGTNRIEAILGGCVLYESWTGAGVSRGHSFTLYDRGDHRWHQTWVDNAGTFLRLAGGLVNGEMVLEGQRRLADGSETTERITWTPNADGSVRQLWQSSRDRAMRWTVVFDGTYRRSR